VIFLYVRRSGKRIREEKEKEATENTATYAGILLNSCLLEYNTV
jgi:hypothetical protein